MFSIPDTPHFSSAQLQHAGKHHWHPASQEGGTEDQGGHGFFSLLTSFVSKRVRGGFFLVSAMVQEQGASFTASSNCYAEPNGEHIICYFGEGKA